MDTNNQPTYEQLLKENKKLKEENRIYKENDGEALMEFTELVNKDLDVALEKITELERELKTHQFIWKDLLLEYIKTSLSSENPIYEEPLQLMHDACFEYNNEEQQFMISRINKLLDDMNDEDWNEDGRACKLTITHNRIPSNYMSDRFIVHISTEVESDNIDDGYII